MKRISSKKAVALITSLTILMMVSIMGITFVKMATIETSAAINYSDAVTGRFLAMSGIEHAVAQLQIDFTGNPITASQDWLYSNQDTDVNYDATTNPADSSQKADDKIGAGIPIEHIYDTSNPNTGNHPSYKTVIVGRNVSGEVAVSDSSNRYVYTLKIFDATSQINLNNHIEPEDMQDTDNSHATPIAWQADLLNHLSSAITLREPYKSSSGADLMYGPLHNLGAAIMQKRKALNGFISKCDLVGDYTPYGGSGSITMQDVLYIWDFITVYPPVEKMNDNALYRSITWDTTVGVESPVKEDYRSPINLNTASWPVLVAVLWGLSNGTVTVNEFEARKLANKICDRRATSPFTSLDDFDTFLSDQKNPKGAFSDGTNPIANADTKIALIKANINPNVVLKRTNPDKPLYQEVNKIDLQYYTTEFCLFPLGMFEITSLGQILDGGGIPQVSIPYYAAIKTFDVYSHTTQDDFEGAAWEIYDKANATNFRNDRIGASASAPPATRKGLHAFSYSGNLQGYTPSTFDKTNWLAAANDYTGYIQPVGYNLNTGCPLWDVETNWRFKANFNGTLAADKEDSPTSSTGTKTTSDLMADGVVFRAGETTTLTYQCRAAGTLADIDGNFPRVVEGEWSMEDGSYNKGAVLFWFKVGKDWVANEWRTVFFVNNKYDDDIFDAGVQMCIMMRITGPDTINDDNIDTDISDNTSTPLLRTLEVQVRAKYHSYDAGSPVNPTVFNDFAGHRYAPFPFDPTATNYTDGTKGYVDYGRRLILGPKHDVCGSVKAGIHAQEWYHLAVRWQWGTMLDGFTEYSEHPILVGGNLYNDDDTLYGSGPHAYLTGNNHHINRRDFLLPDGSNLQDLSGYEAAGDQDKYGRLVYTTTLAASQFTAIEPNLRDGSHRIFYVGYVPGNLGYTATSTGFMITIDDVRVSKIFNFYEDDFYPTRYPRPTSVPASSGDVEDYGIFKGKLSPAPTGNYITHYTTIRSPNPVQSGGTVSSSDMPSGQWRQLWKDMTQKNPSTLDTGWLDKWAHVDIKVSQPSTLYHKDGSVLIKKSNGSDESSMPISIDTDLSANEDDADPRTYTFNPADGSNYSNPQGYTLADRLIQWYRARNNGQNPPQFKGTQNLTGVKVDYDSVNHTYDIKFQASYPWGEASSPRDSGVQPIYDSPIVEDILMLYTGKLEYFAYFDFGILR